VDVSSALAVFLALGLAAAVVVVRFGIGFGASRVFVQPFNLTVLGASWARVEIERFKKTVNATPTARRPGKKSTWHLTQPRGRR